MLVCRRCHGLDRLTTRCEKNFESHRVWRWGNCSVCGKWLEVRRCDKYPEDIENRLLDRKMEDDEIPEGWRYRMRMTGPGPDY